MVLTDREIEAAINTSRIVIDPSPTSEMFGSMSLDLTLATDAFLWLEPTKGVEQIICPAAPDYLYRTVSKEHTTQIEIGEGFILEPRAFLLAYTSQDVTLPTASGIAARVEGKSSIARLGIGVHLTAPTIHSGFTGRIQLEICNSGPLKVKLVAGMPICQLIFEQTYGTPAKGYIGQFQNQGR